MTARLRVEATVVEGIYVDSNAIAIIASERPSVGSIRSSQPSVIVV